MNRDQNIIAYYEIKGNKQILVDVKYIDKGENPMDYQGDYLIYMGNHKNQLGKHITYFGKVVKDKYECTCSVLTTDFEDLEITLELESEYELRDDYRLALRMLKRKYINNDILDVQNVHWVRRIDS